MVIPFATTATAPVPLLSDSQQAELAVAAAKRALGILTRLANDASTVTDALYLHQCANQVEAAAIGAVGVAIDRADALCAKN